VRPIGLINAPKHFREFKQTMGLDVVFCGYLHLRLLAPFQNEGEIISAARRDFNSDNFGVEAVEMLWKSRSNR
jgi:hypothetical protein